MIQLFPLLLLFSAQADHGMKFDDTAAAAGVLHNGWGRGAAIVDFDQDGLVDFYSTNNTGVDAVFRQDPANPGTFIDVTVAWGFTHDTRAESGVVAADFDNDGDLDVFVPCGGFIGPQKDRMYRNDLNTLGVFTDVFSIGLGGDLATLNNASFGATALDADGDGLLDLFMSNNIYTDTQTGQSVYPQDTFLANLGNFMFYDITDQVGIDQFADSRHCSTGDINNDGFPDIGVSNFAGEQVLWLNDGLGNFRDVHQAIGFISNDNGFGVVLEDMNNDGWQDIVVPRFRMWTHFFISNGNGHFTKATNTGIKQHDVMGHNVSDMDMDGFPDVLLGTGHSASVQPDVFYLTLPQGANGIKVLDFSTKSRINSPGLTRCHGQPVGDVNGDLWPDVFFCNGGPPSYPNSNGDKSLFISRGNLNHRVRVGVEGIESNRGGIGARITAHLPSGALVHKQIIAGKGFCNTDEPVAYLGLGAETAVDYMEIAWTGGRLQRVLAPAVDASYKFIETSIALSGTPALGGAMDIDAIGPPLDNVTLWYSTSSTFQVDPAHGGVLELGGTLNTLSTFSLDASGRFLGQIVLPSDVSLAGTTIYLQAFYENQAQTTKGLSTMVSVAIP